MTAAIAGGALFWDRIGCRQSDRNGADTISPVSAGPHLVGGAADIMASVASLRHFARLFRSEVAVTPAAWVEAARAAAARRLLEEGHGAPKQVAARCGFADADTLRRAFARHVGVTPAEYRKRHAMPG
jgi:methylphosphotriester-DNA--protein-cysteine methyltransferase